MAETDFDFFGGGSLKHQTGKEKESKDIYYHLEERGYTIADTKQEAEQITADSKKVYMVAETVQDDGHEHMLLTKTVIARP